jgi:uroporphyrin-III C-methyltransferase / precorrin-2 dehydrogenase / sirohydrochlorin ferrochelatase
MPGKAYIVGAGPGAADLLTLRAASLLREAHVVLHDDLVPQEILDLCPKSAQIVNVGKRCGRHGSSQEQINALMVWYAAEDQPRGAEERIIVRLKSGDPAVFGRLGEELDALRRNGIPFEVVPGITAAAAAAAAAEITLTDRRAASALVIVTAHNCRNESLQQTIFDPGRSTYAIYMPGPDYSRTARELLQSGLEGSTPCAVVSNAGRSNQQTRFLPLAELASAQGIPAPALLIVGEVAKEHSPRFCGDEDHPPAIEGTSVTSSPSLNL